MSHDFTYNGFEGVIILFLFKQDDWCVFFIFVFLLWHHYYKVIFWNSNLTASPTGSTWNRTCGWFGHVFRSIMSLTWDDVINSIIKQVNPETQLVQFSVWMCIHVFFQQPFMLSNMLCSLCTLLHVKFLLIVQHLLLMVKFALVWN